MKKQYIWFQHLIIVFCLLLTGCQGAYVVNYTPPKQRAMLANERPWLKNHFLTLAYHDVEDEGANQAYLAVRTSALNDQISWLIDHDYHFISVQQIIDAHNGVKDLPPRAVLISFDDGYSSFYRRVYPLLLAYHIHALWAPVGSWVSTPADQKVNFGGLISPRKQFSNWQQIKQLGHSPLVEIGSHTWNSHFGSIADPQLSKEPTAAYHRYDAKTGKYETSAQFIARMDKDVTHITDKIAQVTGKKPRVWVWPYGEASGETLSILKRHSYQLAFTLEDGIGDVQHLNNIPRLLMTNNPTIQNFAAQIQAEEQHDFVRAVHVDLDYVYDKDPIQEKKNIDALIQRIYDMRASTVFLQAYADPDGDGTADAVYFPNHLLPVRQDLFNYISWQIQTRDHNAQVFAWMPVTAFNLASSIPRVKYMRGDDNRALIDKKQPIRLSVFSAKAREKITELYQDLARYSSFSGILYSDDAMLSDFEDASEPALNAYQKAGFPRSIAKIRQNPELFARWTRFKSHALIKFTNHLTKAVRAIRGPQIQTARNIFANPILHPHSEAWFAQNLDDFLANYDWTVPMAMPYMEKVPKSQDNKWLNQLVLAVKSHPGAIDKTIFELQTLDWNKTGAQQKISSKKIAQWMRQLQYSGARHLAYYPDDFLFNHPRLSTIYPVFSTYWYPKDE
ncbi:poly-beta-1,6-N-acetyl-D-glucosamine N-deacetylase PgaB [Celerinatantimonas sp. MCCC 1A17872]|uniref:poly-beta-1,6-N-acetyl-D-glucosamine N-deacetylase PgaB n=1 Tax=Celerinatantimonas sp. MCCC 1A17872 TaxID=3177514 RepID=UPI0038C9789E